MKTFLAVLLSMLWTGTSVWAEIQTDWAFHSIGEGGRLSDPSRLSRLVGTLLDGSLPE